MIEQLHRNADMLEPKKAFTKAQANHARDLLQPVHLYAGAMHSIFVEALTPKGAALLLTDNEGGTMNFGLTVLGAFTLKNEAVWLACVAKVFSLPVILSTRNPS